MRKIFFAEKPYSDTSDKRKLTEDMVAEPVVTKSTAAAFATIPQDTPSPQYSGAAGVQTDVILHAFDWPYAQVATHAEQIRSLGYRTVLVSPPMKSFIHPQGTPWWQRYQPQDYRVIDNQLGNTKDFFNMVKVLRVQGVQVYVDVVFNHMANESWRRVDLQYPSSTDLQKYLDQWEEYQSLLLFGDLREPLFDENDFVEAFGIEDWKNKWQVQNGRISGGPEDPGLPTLRDNDHVVAQQQNYLRALKGMGVKGFRIDAAKHMTLAHLKRVWTDEIIEGVHIFGEIITDGGATKQEYELFLQPYLEDTKLGAYDFPLFNTIYQAFSPDGDMASLIDPFCFGQALSSPRAITFAITHDIPNNDVFRSLILDEKMEWLAHCYLLGRDGGVPLIYADLDPSGVLNEQGDARWRDCWQDPRMAAMIAFHNYAHGEPMSYMMGDADYLVFARGAKGIVAINKSEQPIYVTLNWPTDMKDLLSGAQYQAQDGELIFTIKAHSCLMMIAE